MDVFREERCQVQQRQPQFQYALKPSLIKLDQSHLLLKTFLRESCGAFLSEAVGKGRKVFQIVVDSKQDKGVDASTLIPIVHKLALGRCCCCYYFCLPYNNFSRRKSHERLSWTRSLPDSLIFMLLPTSEMATPACGTFPNSIQGSYNLDILTFAFH